LSIVTNFGLLLQRDDGWLMVCEAAVGGGLITRGVRTDLGHFVSTTEGLFLEQDDCEYAGVQLGIGDDWPLAFTSTTLDDQQLDFVLVLDQETDEISAARSRDGGDFEVLQTFPREDGYRQISASGSGPWLFATGQTFSPRVWHVAWSDGGDEWDKASFDVDDTESTLIPLGSDPDEPQRLLLLAQTPSDQPGQLWLFDGDSAELEPIFTLPGTQTLVGFAATKSSWLLAANDDEQGKIYAAPRGSTDFEPREAVLPLVSCLRVFDGEPYVCGADFTRYAPFVLARSDDEGESWQSVMALEELGRVDTCSTSCDDTIQWLHATYGPLSVGGVFLPGDAGVADAGPPPVRPGFEELPAEGESAEQDAGASSDSGASRRKRSSDPKAEVGDSDGGCALGRKSTRSWAWLAFAIVALAVTRRRAYVTR
jgi:hypothetical protein